MSLHVFNTKTRTMELFQARDPGVVRLYVCGPTVYEHPHLGHGRSYVFYDVVKRYFLWKGMDVDHVQNFTDIEESIKLRAEEAGLPPLEYADGYIRHFLDDMDALRVLRADHYPRVSEHIDEIVAAVQDLVDKDYAYLVDCRNGKRDGKTGRVCDVYFDVTKWPRFGELVGQSPDELAVDRPDEKGERRHPMDFALWKAHDDWGVTWPSPWGDGRPGWHVECTTMAFKYLGTEFDVHGGGLDLIFPHHESEQSIGEAWTGEPYCRYFVHNGFVTVNRQKMSKSQGNFIILKGLLKEHDPEALRLFLVTQHYRVGLDYDEDQFHDAAQRLARWRDAVRHLKDAAPDATGNPEKLPDGLRKHRDAFISGLEDDFHLERAADAVDAAARDAHALTGDDAAHALAFFKEVAEVLGVLWELDTRWQAPAATAERRA